MKWLCFGMFVMLFCDALCDEIRQFQATSNQIMHEAAAPIQGYVKEQYWYNSKNCANIGHFDFVNVFAVGSCYAYTGGNYVFYTFVGSILNPSFKVDMQIYRDPLCKSSIGSKTTGKYTSNCTVVSSSSSMNSWFSPIVPEFNSPGSVTRYGFGLPHIFLLNEHSGFILCLIALMNPTPCIGNVVVHA
jgi:hypothetical protein